MNLRTKAITMVCVAMLTLCLCGLGVAYLLFRNNYTHVDQKEGQHRLRVAVNTLAYQSESLQEICRDWGQWPELHNFVKGSNESFVADNLSTEQPKHRSLDYLAILNAQKDVLFQSVPCCDIEINPAMAKSLELAQLSVVDAFDLSETKNVASGLVEFYGSPMFMACQPVRSVDEDKSIIGWVIAGRTIDKHELTSIGEVAGVETNLSPRPKITSACGEMVVSALRYMDESKSNQVVIASENTLCGYMLLNDFSGKRKFLLTTHAPRNTFIQGVKTVKASLLALLISGMVFAVAIIVVMNRYIVGPISKLNAAMQDVIKTGESKGQFNVDSKDEIGQLGRSFALMMESISNTESKLRDAMSEAQQSNQLKSKFLSMISHEIRTPLNGIIGLNDAILAANDTPIIHNHAHKINAESEHLLDLINTLLDNARIEAGKMDIESLPMSLEKLTQDLISHCNARAAKKQLQFKVELSSDTPVNVLGDELRLKQILLNLTTNAIKFTDSGSVVVNIGVKEQADNIAIISFEVLDTGIGIAKEQQKHIFESFSQADCGTTRKFGGTGLGTTISKNLVDLMGGTIQMESQIGLGSRFWFDLPMEICDEELLDQIDQYEDEISHPETPLAPASDILVVEDYPINQEVVKMHLEHAGHHVTIASDGVEAVTAVTQKQFDLILMDLQMPNMDGIEATRKIRTIDEYNATIPIIALSANTDVDSFVTCMEAGMNDYLTKPIRRENLLEILSRWLSGMREDDNTDTEDNQDTSLDSAPSFADCSNEPVDIARAVEEFCGSHELVMKTLRQFADLLPQQLQEIRDAMSRSDLQTVGSQAHKIKGGAANLAADPLAKAAKNLEDSAKNGDVNTSTKHIENVAVQIDTLVEFTAADF